MTLGPVSMVSADDKRKTLMIWACVLMLAGGFAAQHSRLMLSSDICEPLIVASLLMLTGRRTRLVACFTFGIGWFLLAGQQIVDARLQPRYAGDSLLTDVRIIDFPKKLGDSIVMLVEPVGDARLPPRSRVSWFEPTTIPAIGEVWQLELRLRRPRGLSNPGVFDREAWLFRNAIHATGYVVGGHRNRRLESGGNRGIGALRRDFVEQSFEAATSADTAAVLSAIGVGARQHMSREQWDRYAISGTSHLMAISGLHIGLAASAAFLFARVLTGIVPGIGNTHLASMLLAVAAACAYAVVSGLGVPAQRAALMLIFAVVAILRRRSVSPLAILAQAAAIVFLVNPVAIMAPGFQLSFAAVLLLLWRAKFHQHRWQSRRLVARPGNALRQLASLQVALLFGLMPLTIVLFQRVAPLALPVNLFAVPLFTVVTVPLTLVGLALGGIFDSAARVALVVAGRGVSVLEAVIARLVVLPFADINIIGVTELAWPIVCLPVLLALLPRGWPGRYAAALAVVALLTQPPVRPPSGCIDTHVLDVGQGLATVLQTPTRTLVFDTGASFRGGGSVAEQVIVPFLKSRGLAVIDWLVVSHADIDHSGGVAALTEYAVIGELRAGEWLAHSVPHSGLCRAGQSFSADGVRFKVLHPGPTSAREGNDASCVLRVETGSHAILMTGDIEAAAEEEILRRGGWTGVDAVVIPHHGSLTSSSARFVAAVAPDLAIVSAGFGNRWGFPKPVVTARWRAAGATVLNTATSGAVSFRVCRDSGLGEARLDRHERRRFWR